MASPHVTPFIPPSPVPDIAPGARTPVSPQPPVVPSPPGPGVSIPDWALGPQHAANYPMYPPAPYAAQGFVHYPTPAMASGQIPGGFPPPAGPIYSQGPPHGVSMDYTGYPAFPGAPPPTPYTHPGAPQAGGFMWSPMHHGPPTAHPVVPPWNNTPRHGYQPFQQPPGPPHGGGGPPYGGGGPPGWGGHTPGHGLGMPLDPYRGHIPPTWAQQNAMQYTQPAPPPRQLPQHLQGELGRAATNVGDRVNPFMAGNHYGPVLKPFLLRVVRAQLKLNPLITPPPENGADRPYLQWNMLFPSAQCRKSTDEAHISWQAGRDEPATFPRVTSIRIVCEFFPWIIAIDARDENVGVTCGEIIDALAENHARMSLELDWKALSARRRSQVAEAYTHNRSTAFGVPGGRLGRGMRRVDFLCKSTMFGGLVLDEPMLRTLCGDVLPCMFALKCLTRYALTQEEIRDQEARDRVMAEAEARRARRATVETDSEGEDSP